MKNTILAIAALSLLIIGANNVFASEYGRLSVYNTNTVNNKLTKNIHKVDKRTINNTRKYTTNNIDKSVSQNQGQKQNATGGAAQSSSDNSVSVTGDDYEKPAANSPYVSVTSLIECPDTSGGGGVGTRPVVISFSVARKDKDCAKIRLAQNIAAMYPESPRHQALIDNMMCTLDLWKEITKETGFTCAAFMALEPQQVTAHTHDEYANKESLNRAFKQSQGK